MDGKVTMISENIDHTRSVTPHWSERGGGCHWDAEGCNTATYDNKTLLATRFGVYQRLHSRNDGLVTGQF